MHRVQQTLIALYHAPSSTAINHLTPTHSLGVGVHGLKYGVTLTHLNSRAFSQFFITFFMLFLILAPWGSSCTGLSMG